MTSTHNQTKVETTNTFASTPVFQNQDFAQMLSSYNAAATAQHSVDLTQAFLMTKNFCAAANSLPSYKSVTEFLNSSANLTDSMHHIGRLV